MLAVGGTRSACTPTARRGTRGPETGGARGVRARLAAPADPSATHPRAKEQCRILSGEWGYSSGPGRASTRRCGELAGARRVLTRQSPPRVPIVDSGTMARGGPHRPQGRFLTSTHFGNRCATPSPRWPSGARCPRKVRAPLTRPRPPTRRRAGPDPVRCGCSPTAGRLALGTPGDDLPRCLLRPGRGAHGGGVAGVDHRRLAARHEVLIPASRTAQHSAVNDQPAAAGAAPLGWPARTGCDGDNLNGPGPQVTFAAGSKGPNENGDPAWAFAAAGPRLAPELRVGHRACHGWNRAAAGRFRQTRWARPRLSLAVTAGAGRGASASRPSPCRRDGTPREGPAWSGGRSPLARTDAALQPGVEVADLGSFAEETGHRCHNPLGLEGCCRCGAHRRISECLPRCRVATGCGDAWRPATIAWVDRRGLSPRGGTPSFSHRGRDRADFFRGA